MIVLDANVLIGFLDGSDPHHAASTDLLERRFAAGFAASVLTVAECLVHPTRANRHDAVISALERIALQIVPLNAADAAGLARVRGDYRLRMPDAVALYTALSTGSELASFDDAVRAAAARAGLRIAD